MGHAQLHRHSGSSRSTPSQLHAGCSPLGGTAYVPSSVLLSCPCRRCSFLNGVFGRVVRGPVVVRVVLIPALLLMPLLLLTCRPHAHPHGQHPAVVGRPLADDQAGDCTAHRLCGRYGSCTKPQQH